MKREELKTVHDALSLLNSMVNSGEQHSQTSRSIMELAFEILKNDSAYASLSPAEGAECKHDYVYKIMADHTAADVCTKCKHIKKQTAEGAEANRHIRQLKEFHTAFNLPQRDIPTIIPPDEFKLRHKILVEEVGELSDAYFVDDIVEVADAITDCLYVLIGTALQFGIADKLEACFDEVHRSNMSKLGNDGYPIMREDGKVMKGENYTRPDLKSILSEPIVAQQQPTAEGADEILEQSFRKVLQSVALHGYDLICAENDCIKIANDFTTLHAKRIADKMVWDMRKKLFSMRATKESMDKLSEADRLMMYGYHDCINEILMWTKGIEK